MNVADISIVTPTLRRPAEVIGLLENLSQQSVLPSEVILVDGAPSRETATELAVDGIKFNFPFSVKYLRHGGGTAIQRNVGINQAGGSFIAFIDDDVRLEVDFLKNILAAFSEDSQNKVGGIVGYRTNQHFTLEESQRWRWYKRLKLLTVYEPGRYDFECGYPINNNLQPRFSGTRPVDFMTTACAVWRRDVFDSGLRFDAFFRDYGVLEDAHFSLRAGRKWTLLQSGDAHCEEMHSPNGRVDRRLIGYKSVVNYYFVFQQIAGPLELAQKYRFWRYQAFEGFRVGASALRRRNWGDFSDLRGRLEGISRILFSKL
jgi:glycosyltransferase involved in cell wall biosynthesis